MAGRLQWDGDRVQAAIRAEMGRRIGAACVLVLNRARALISVAGTIKGEAGRDAKGRFIRQYDSNPSAPGEPPHKQTGTLRRSVAREVDAASLRGRVGTNLKYGRWLELGTQRMAARPWLRRALAECAVAIRAIFTRPMT